MSYRKATDLIPAELLEQIQQYVDGGYIYIPRSNQTRAEWGTHTSTRAELARRNHDIYKDYQSGITSSQLSEKYFLSVKSIHRIIRTQRA